MTDRKPPKIGQKLLARLPYSHEQEALLGEFVEIFKDKSTRRGRTAAYIWYWFQILTLIPGAVLDSFAWSYEMFKNYFKIAVRNLKKHKSYSFINIAGLSIGMTCFILILLFVRNELSFDSFHEKSERIYRVVLEREQSGRFWELQLRGSFFYLQSSSLNGS